MNKNEVSIFECDVELGDAVFNLSRICKKEISGTNADNDIKSILHSHTYYECHLILSGVTVFTVENDGVLHKGADVHTVKSGELFIIPPHTPHYPFTRQEDCNEIVFILSLRKVKGNEGFFDYFSAALETAVCCPVSLDSSLIENIIRFCEGAEEYSIKTICRRKSIAYSIITALFEQIDTSAFSTPKSSKESERVRDITLGYLVTDYSTPISAIAKKLGYTTRHTSRLIRELYGKSLRDVRNENMLTSAKDLIKSYPEFSLSQIARKSGFSSLTAMRSAFEKSEKMTPKEYKDAIFTESQKK